MREPRILTDEEIADWMRRQQWIYARSMPRHPHHYSLKRLQDPRRFEDVVLTIWERGYDRKYLNRLWRSLDVGDRHYIWVHTEPGPGVVAPVGQTVLVNRAQRAQERLFRRRPRATGLLHSWSAYSGAVEGEGMLKPRVSASLHDPPTIPSPSMCTTKQPLC